jgi:hypothetical protein
MDTYSLALRVYDHSTVSASDNPGLLSILLDLVEEGDWQTLQGGEGEEPEILALCPSLVPGLIQDARKAGFSAVVQRGRSSTIDDTTFFGPGGTTFSFRSSHPIQVDEVYPVYVWLHQSADTAHAAAKAFVQRHGYDAFLLNGGVTLSLNRSALSIFLSSPAFHAVMTWVDHALAHLDLPVTRWTTTSE